MGRQINFFLHPDEQKDFETILKSSGEVSFLPYYHYDNRVKVIQDTLDNDIKKNGTRVYVVRQSDLTQIKLQHIEKFGYWLVDDNELPVLHYDRCLFENGKIRSGRLYFQPQFVREMQWVSKSDTFVNWADNIIKTARRKLKRYKFDMGGWSYSEYVGKQTQLWLDKTKSELGKTDDELVIT